MRITSNPQATMISLLCGVVFTATAAVAQTSATTETKSPSTTTQTKSSDTATKTMQGQNPSVMQSDGFFQGLVNLPMQSETEFKPTIGSTVPKHVTLHPMPSEAAKAMPGVKDHHVAKTDKNTAVIADPTTRKILHIISPSDSTASTKKPVTGTKSTGTSSSGSK